MHKFKIPLEVATLAPKYVFGVFFFPFYLLSIAWTIFLPIVLLLKILITTLHSWNSLVFESLNIYYDLNLWNLIMIYKNSQCPSLKLVASRHPCPISWTLGLWVPLQYPHTCFSFSIPSSLSSPAVLFMVNVSVVLPSSHSSWFLSQH